MPEKFPSGEGEDFLKEKYPDLANSSEVENAARRQEVLLEEEKPKNKQEKIQAYLRRLGEIFGIEEESKKERLVDFLKNKLHEKFVIKEIDIPESYFKNQQRIAREQGYGDVDITSEMRSQSAEIIIKDQCQSLDNWMDYLGSGDATYPDWLKYWAMRSVANLAQGEKDENGKVSFSKREFAKYDKEGKVKNSPTVKPFPDINREALAYVLDAVQKSQKQKLEEEGHMQKVKQALPKDVALTNKQEQEVKNRLREEKNAGQPIDEQWEKILKSENFAELYAHAIEKITPASEEEKENIQGEWVKYEQGSDAKPLYESLQGHGTGWCTAGESTAQAQLEVGDFYVFYSKDKQGLNKIPRIAIRMQEGEIAEVRGIQAGQNLEGSMVDIANEKYITLPGGDKYEKKAGDMKRLTEIEKKFYSTIEVEQKINILFNIWKEKSEFNEEEQKENDELMLELAMLRIGNAKMILDEKDERFLNEVDGKIEGFGYARDPRIDKLKNHKNVDLTTFKSVKGVEFPEVIHGDLILGDVFWAEDYQLILPLRIEGNLDIHCLEDISGVTLPKFVGGNLYIGNLQSTNGVTFPEIIEGDLYLDGAVNRLIQTDYIDNFNPPKILKGNIHVTDLDPSVEEKLKEKYPDLKIKNKVTKK